MQDHVPSITHVVAFVVKRGRRRAGIVRQQRKQVEAPRGERGFGYFYAKLISAIISFVENGLQDTSLSTAVEASTPRERRSYAEVAQGIDPVLRALAPSGAARINVSKHYLGEDGSKLLTTRPHLRFTWPQGRSAVVYVHFSDAELTPDAVAVTLHVLRQCYPGEETIVIDARHGAHYRDGTSVDDNSAATLLLAELEDYAAFWDGA